MARLAFRIELGHHLGALGEELDFRDPEGCGDLMNNPERGVSDSSLDAADVGAVEARLFCEGLL